MSKKQYELNGFTVNKDPVKPLWKSPCIMGQTEPNTSFPMVYLKKPKWISDKSFNDVIDSIRLQLPSGFTITSTKP